MQTRATYSHTETITATGQTTYSPWYEVDWANEMYSWAQFEESETGSSESIVVTAERHVRHSGVSNQTVLTHSTFTAAANEEKYGTTIPDGDAAVTGTNKLGGKVRWKFVSSGNFASDQIVTITMVMEVFRR